MKKSINQKSIIFSLTAFFITAIVVFSVFLMNALVVNKTKENQLKMQKVYSPEELMAKHYDELTEDDENTNTQFVRFSAFFTKDLNEDGNANKVNGTCKFITEQDILYIDVNVLTEGYLKDGEIKIESDNFNWSTTMVKDSIISQNYVGNTSLIKLNPTVDCGSEKLMWGDISSKLGQNINNYSAVSKITLTGTHVDNEGHETPINVTRNVTVDWYADVNAMINTHTVNRNISDLEKDSEKIHIDFTVETQASTKGLIKDTDVKLEIAKLNGYNPLTVRCSADSDYDEENRILTIHSESNVDTDGTIIESISGKNRYKIDVEYPIEAYSDTVDTILLEYPVETTYSIYNNKNEEFTNPLKSNPAKGILVISYKKPTGSVYDTNIEVGYKREKDWYILKKNVIGIYNGRTETGVDYYPVVWTLKRGDEGEISSVVLKQTQPDEFIDANKEHISMNEYVENYGIYFSGANGALGNSGEISVYNDDTNELIHKFTKEDWNNYNSSNPYIYDSVVKKVRVETTAAAKNSTLIVNHIKKLDDKLITEVISKENFDKFKYIESYLTSIVNNDESTDRNNSATANYLDEISSAKLKISSNSIGNSKTCENFGISIDTENNINSAKWKDGQFIVQLPNDIIAAKLNSVTMNSQKAEIAGYELYQEKNCYFIKVMVQNEEETHYSIRIDCDITPNPASPTSTNWFYLYGYNDLTTNYEKETADDYDLNNNGNLEEIVGYDMATITFIAPNTILTNQYLTDYSDEEETTMAPNYADVETEQRTAKVNLSIINNYSGTISDIKIKGTIPFEGNKYPINNYDIGSEFTTEMLPQGINIPDTYKDIVKVYYSENELTTTDLNDSNNGWELNPTDWTKVKTYLIDFGDYVMPASRSAKFTYDIKIPEGIALNKVSYSDHAIYYNLDTPEGKLAIETEPAKLGVRIAQKYLFNLKKFKKYTDKLVGGCTYKISESEEFYKLFTTTESGDNQIKLNIGQEYTLKEIRSNSDYVLDDEEIKFKVDFDENNQLKVYTTSSKGFSSEPITKDENTGVSVTVEDMPKYNLVVNKTSLNDDLIENVVFKLTSDTSTYREVTGIDGQVRFKSLTPGIEYTLKEMKADGYYIDSTDRKFVVNYTNDGWSVQSTDEIMQTIEFDEDSDTGVEIATANIKNEKIPTYKLQILKIAETDEEDLSNVEPLQGAEFTFRGTDTGMYRKFTTDENGIIEIDNLYQYVNGKYITGEYTIEENIPPVGYSKSPEIVKLKAEVIDDELNVRVENINNLNSVNRVYVEDNIVKLILQDKPLFELTKIDAQTNLPMPNVGFVIWKLDAEGNRTDFAKDINGNYVGTLNEDNNYIVYTNEKGIIKLPLEPGKYEAVEMVVEDKYIMQPGTSIFVIAGDISTESEESEETGGTEAGNEEGKVVINISFIEDLVDISIDSEENENNFSNNIIKLTKDLDFKSRSSYKNPDDTSYGDLNEDGTIEGIMEELTKEEGCGFKPIAKTTASAFSGIFDGNNYSIKNLYICELNRNYTYLDPEGQNYGLFGIVNNAQIKNLTLQGKYNLIKKEQIGGFVGSVRGINKTLISNCCNQIEITGENNYYVGGIVGYSGENNKENVKIYNCRNISNITDNAAGYMFAGILGNGYGTIEKCYNSGNIDLSHSGRRAAGIAGSIKGTVKDSYNIANISASGITCGGIVAEARDCEITNCYNTGNVTASTYTGGISGDSGEIKNCYNTGTITGGNFTAGINGTGANVYNCYNTGDINSTSDASGITGQGGKVICCFNEGTINGSRALGIGKGSSEITNCYNNGTLNASSVAAGISDSYSNASYCYNTGNIMGTAGALTTINGNDGYTGNNVYYLDSITIQGETITRVGTSVTSEELKSKDFYNHLNKDGVWLFEPNGYPKLFNINNIPERSEVTIYNNIKEFKVTTEVGINGDGGRVGGTIDGEPNQFYPVYIKYVETIKYGEDSINNIKMIPNNGYRITNITINGKKIDYVIKEDGSYEIPEGYFANVKEDKHIVVIFDRTNTILTINKVDEDDENIKLSGAKFKIERVDERPEPGVINTWTNKSESDAVDYNSDLSNKLEQLTTDSTESTYFSSDDYEMYNNVIEEGTQTYPDDGMEVGHRYIEVDLTGKEGSYAIVANFSYETSNKNYSALNIAVTENSSDGQYVGDNYYYNDSSVNNKSIFIITLEGNKKYYVHMFTMKSTDSTVSVNDSLNNIKAYKLYTDTFRFENVNNTYTPNNLDKCMSSASGYIVVDLTNETEDAILELKAKGKLYDYSIFRVAVNNTESSSYIGSIINMQEGDNEEKTVLKKLSAGQKYYIHLVYNNYSLDAADEVEVSSLKLYKLKPYVIENEGKIETNTMDIDNSRACVVMPIDLSRTTGKYKLVINAQVSSEENDKAFAVINTSENTPGNNYEDKLFEISGEVEATDYEKILVAGQKYYLHFVYSKDAENKAGQDKFIINKVEVIRDDPGYPVITTETNSDGTATARLQNAKYSITEIEAPEGYKLLDEPVIYQMNLGNSENSVVIKNKKASKVIEHHYLEGTGPENGTEPTVLAPDKNYYGDINEDYTTAPKMDIEGFTLIKDNTGKYVIPENASGKFTDDVIEVTYYYNGTPVRLTVHHYLYGTQRKLAEDRGPEIHAKGYNYTTEADQDLLDRYELVYVDGDESGILNEDTEINYYYKMKEYTIVTRVEIPEGQDNKGGIISGEGEKPYETVLSGNNSVNEVKMTPDNGYRIDRIIVNKIENGQIIESKEVEFEVNEDGTYTLPQIQNVQNDYEIVVRYVPDAGKVIVHHYIEGTETSIAPNEITNGNIGKVVHTSDVNTARYDLVEDSAEYALVEAPDNRDVVIERNDKHVIYYYQRQYKITTDVIEHLEEVKDEITGEIENKSIKGGTITGELTEENTEPVEKVLKGRNSTKEIVITPDYGYRIKVITIKDGENAAEVVDLTEFMQEDGKTAIIPEGYFENMQADKHIEVEFERIPAKVIVKYLEIDTNIELHEDKEIDGFVKDSYDEDRIDIESYTATNPEPENNKGEMTEETITVIYYYKKQYKITTDVKEHEEEEKANIIDLIVDNKDKTETSSESNKVMVKGGSITGELTETNKAPVEVVTKGESNTKEIVMIPDYGYTIKSVTIYSEEGTTEISVKDMIGKDGQIVIPAKYFENMQSDKHIVVEYEPLPAKVTVVYKDKEDGKEIEDQEAGKGLVGDEYYTYDKVIPYYELIKKEIPLNKNGKLTPEDTIVTYWYRKLLFNMKITKEFTSVLVNNKEMLAKDNKLVKIDIDKKQLNDTSIVVKYKIVVTNTEEVAGVAKVVEEIPAGFILSLQNKEKWTLVDGKYQLTTKELKPGESAEYEIILEWDGNVDHIGRLENIAKIVETENEPDYAETTLEDNQDNCVLLIEIRTGMKNYTIIVIALTLTMLGLICFIIKKIRV